MIVMHVSVHEPQKPLLGRVVDFATFNEKVLHLQCVFLTNYLILVNELDLLKLLSNLGFLVFFINLGLELILV